MSYDEQGLIKEFAYAGCNPQDYLQANVEREWASLCREATCD